MALSRLFLAEAELHLPKTGFLKLERWLSSSSPSPSPSPSTSSKKGVKVSKRSKAAKEKKAEAVKSFIERYMVMHPGVFPKEKQVHDEVGGSLCILKEILTEVKNKMLSNSQIDKQSASAKSHPAVQTASEATEKEESTGSSKLDSPETVEEKAVAESCVIADKDSKASAIIKNSDNAELVFPKQMQQLMGGLNSTVFNQQLSCTTIQIVKEASATDMQVFDAKLTEVTPYGNGDYQTDRNDLAPIQNSVEADRNCLELNLDTLPVEVPASNTKGGITSLVDFFKRRDTDIEESICRKTSTLKYEAPLDSKQDKHIINLVDVFKRNQKDPKDNLISKKSDIIDHDSTSNSKEASGEDSGGISDVRSLLDRIKDLSKYPLTTGSWASVPNDKTNTSKELRSRISKGFVHESLKILSPNEEHTTLSQLDNTELKPEVKTKFEEPKEANISNLVGKDDKVEKKPSSCEIRNGKVQLDLDKVKEAMKVSLDISDSQLTSDESDYDVAAFDYSKTESIDEVPIPTEGLNLNAPSNEETCSHENSLLVKFLLKTAKVNDIGFTFDDCGPITEICIVPSRRENRFNYAYIRFKTEEGLRKALNKTDMVVGGADVTVEPASPSKMHNRMFTVESVKDVDFPMAFLKNPTQTVMVEGLRDDLSFHHLRHALSFCGRVSGFAMGSLNSSVYVEFESEKSKERALAEATILVSGRKLSIVRIDPPKTTVLRISNVNPLTGMAKIRSICDSYGRVKRVVGRDIDTVDVHFKLPEWANMVKILNRLNGIVVDQHQWLTQPATVIPPEILQTLLNKPEGRRHVHRLIQDLCQRIEEKPIDTAPIMGLAHEYYGDSLES